MVVWGGGQIDHARRPVFSLRWRTCVRAALGTGWVHRRRGDGNDGGHQLSGHAAGGPDSGAVGEDARPLPGHGRGAGVSPVREPDPLPGRPPERRRGDHVGRRLCDARPARRRHRARQGPVPHRLRRVVEGQRQVDPAVRDRLGRDDRAEGDRPAGRPARSHAGAGGRGECPVPPIFISSGCIKNADRSAGTGDGTIFAVRRA